MWAVKPLVDESVAGAGDGIVVPTESRVVLRVDAEGLCS